MKEEEKIPVVEETESYPVNPKKETIKFPWAITIIMGILVLLIVACFIAIWVLEH